MRKSALYALGLVVAALVALGLVVLSSASEANALRLTRLTGGDAYHFLKQQAAFIGVGVVLATIVACVDYRLFRDHFWLTIIALLVTIGLLCFVFAFKPVKGSQRWITLIGGLRLQPAEFAKLMVVLVVSVWMDRIKWQVDRFKVGALMPVFFIGLLAVPVMMEPDFGSCIVMGSVGFLIMLVAGSRLTHMILLAIPAVLVLGYKVATNGNRMARIAAKLGFKLDFGASVSDAAADSAAYQAHQALVAIGNGGISGVGLNQSMQKHYYLPEAHTDFIFAIGAEEMGLAFSLGTIFLFCLFFALCIYIATKASDRLGKFIVVGMAFLIFFQAIFNIGMVCDAFVTKGMALPFFSYGGTNMISSFIAVGMILSVGIHSYRDKRTQFASKILSRA